jgi:hypothetical protein
MAQFLYSNVVAPSQISVQLEKDLMLPVPAKKFAVLPQLHQVFDMMGSNIYLVASKARLELSHGNLSPPAPPELVVWPGSPSYGLFVRCMCKIRGR